MVIVVTIPIVALTLMILHAQRVRAVDRRCARHQVGGQRRAAGRRPRARGAGRAEPAGEEGRGAVPHRPDAVRAGGQGRRRRSSRQRRSDARASSTSSWAAPAAASPRRAARCSRPSRPGCSESPGQARVRAQAGRGRTASWCDAAPATGSRSRQAETDVKSSRRSSRPRAACEAQVARQRGAGARRASARCASASAARSATSMRRSAQSPRATRQRQLAARPDDGARAGGRLRDQRAAAHRLVHGRVPDHAGDDLRREDLPGHRALRTRTSCTRSSPATRPSSCSRRIPGQIIKAKVDSIIWAQGQGQVAIARSCRRRASGRRPPGRFPVKLDGRRADADAVPARGRDRPGRGLHRALALLIHIMRKVIAAGGREDRLPDPEAALMRHAASVRSHCWRRRRRGAWRAAR